VWVNEREKLAKEPEELTTEAEKMIKHSTTPKSSRRY
jgi:hypothetical protein